MNVSERAQAMFVEALTVDADTRAEFVTAACGDNIELFEEVKSLLDASAQSEEYFDQLAGNIGLPALADHEPELPADKIIGQWRLVELLGRGGMGSVYLAERADEQFEMRAALKILPFGLNSSEARSRFLLERQILARLVHDNIARLLDGGVTDDGTPYFVMDYVDGKPLDQYCDANSLSIRERIRIFCQVCEAVQYAHRNLVVHRDLKPSNVLLQADGEVKLVDFGIAKTLYPDEGAAQLTRTGITPMTSLYASPEMLKRAPVTTSSDVYALGVLLYELLTGCHPYALPATATGPEIWNSVVDKDPLAPSRAALTAIARNDEENTEQDPDQRAARRRLTARRLSQRLHGDLDAIVSKSLQKNPDRRYASVEQLQADIHRHLNGLPVQAQPPSMLYRVRKFVARRKGLVAAGVVALLFVFTVAYQSRQTQLEAERANREAQVAQQISDFLVSVFEVSNPQRSAGDTITARELLDRGAEQITGDAIEDPETRGRLMRTVGQVYEGLALYDEAESMLNDALDLQVQFLGEDNMETLRTRMVLGILYVEQGRYSDAQASLHATSTDQRRVLGILHPDSLQSMHSLSIAHAQLGNFAAAAKLSEELVLARQQSLGEHHADTLNSQANLAIFYKLQGQWDRAEGAYLSVLAAQRTALGDEHPNTLAPMQNLADLYSDQSRYSEAEPLYQEMLALSHRVYGPEHPTTTRATINFANMYQAMGQYVKAEPLYVQSMTIQRATLGDAHPETLNGISKLGELYVRQEKYDQAEPLLLEARDTYTKSLGPSHYKTLDVLTRMSNMYAGRGETEKLRELTVERLRQRRLLAMRDGASTQDKLSYAWVLVSCEPEELRDPHTALPLALEANEETAFSDPRFLHALAIAYEQTGDYRSAIDTQRKSVELLPDDAITLREEYSRVLESMLVASGRNE